MYIKPTLVLVATAASTLFGVSDAACEVLSFASRQCQGQNLAKRDVTSTGRCLNLGAGASSFLLVGGDCRNILVNSYTSTDCSGSRTSTSRRAAGCYDLSSSANTRSLGVRT